MLKFIPWANRDRLEGTKDKITYGSIFGGLGLATLDCESAAFTLKPLGCDEALNLGSFGIWLFALAFWLYFASDDEFTNLYMKMIISFRVFGDRFLAIDKIQK